MKTHPMIRAIAEALTKEAGSGQLLDAGWRSFKAVMHPGGFPYDLDEQLARYAYYSGAQHLFASIMIVLDSGTEATDNDMQRMDLIYKELEAFERELEGYIALRMKTEGRG